MFCICNHHSSGFAVIGMARLHCSANHSMGQQSKDFRPEIQIFFGARLE